MTRSIQASITTALLTVALVAPSLGGVEITGRVLDTNNSARGIQSEYFVLNIESCTPEGEVAELTKTLDTQGQSATLKAMQSMDRGWIKIGDQLSQEIAIATCKETEEGRVLRVALDRKISFPETWHQTRSTNYPFTVLEIQLSEDNEGEGDLMVATQWSLNAEGELEVKNYQALPSRLTHIKVNDV